LGVVVWLFLVCFLFLVGFWGAGGGGGGIILHMEMVTFILFVVPKSEALMA
jgi:uncharacterized membrane protein